MNDIDTESYYQHVRYDLIEDITDGANRVLEVGCAEGATGHVLKQSGRASEVVGIELDEAASIIATKRLDRVICGDLEQLELNALFNNDDLFDYVICGDVLEHLKDPWDVLYQLLKLLKPGGRAVISLPNIRWYRVSIPLIIFDDWTYQTSGVLDKTHLRFFTKSTAIKMLEEAGLKQLICKPLIHRRRDKILKMFSVGLLTGLLAPQWVFVGVKPSL